MMAQPRSHKGKSTKNQVQGIAFLLWWGLLICYLSRPIDWHSLGGTTGKGKKTTEIEWTDHDVDIDEARHHRRLTGLRPWRVVSDRVDDVNDDERPLRILYTVTTSAEFDGGSRATQRGSDRLRDLLIPVIAESVGSMLSLGYHVDVVVISHYKMARLSSIREALPSQVGLEVWDEASPYSYPHDIKGGTTSVPTLLVLNKKALSRQHRFVIKDRLWQYDLFVNFEDDMVVHGETVQNYLRMTEQLFRIRQTAPESLPTRSGYFQYYGELTKDQLKRCQPGLIRVEVLLDEAQYGTQERLDPVPLDTDPDIAVDPRPCCHLSSDDRSGMRPRQPASDKLFVWETGIVALGVRHIPGMGWTMLQRGPEARDDELGTTLTDYWSGRSHYFPPGQHRPPASSLRHINNMGGWMATQRQIWEWHTEVCPGGILPPFDGPDYERDGLDGRGVEYWSGGLNLVTPIHGCNIQRLVGLDDPDQFARHLIYHSANNKQRQHHAARRQTFVKVNHLYGQLRTVVKDAKARMMKKVPKH
jgi:hypothetical protein